MRCGGHMDREAERERTVLICSVGGTPDPIRKSIDSLQPEYVIYVASPGSRKTIRLDIESALTWKGVADTEVITLVDYQDLLQCVQDIREGLEQSLNKMGLPHDTLLVADITGGTKVMSAALTLVMMEQERSRFFYIGGDRRSKEGLGVVESGHELLMHQDNPWEVTALREVRNLAHLFNSGRFAAALDIARRLAEHMAGREKFYAAVADVLEAYAAWDGFDHKTALKKLRQGIGRLEPYAYGHGRLHRQLEIFRRNGEELERVQLDAQGLLSPDAVPQFGGRAYLIDLLANAERRAAAGRFDDAVARLYSAIEKSAKTALRIRHGIDNSNVDPERTPPSIRESLVAAADENGEIRIGLQKSFDLLEALHDPLGAVYSRHRETLYRALRSRNLSLLAHGFIPVRQGAYEMLRDVALEFLEIHREDLPQFPDLDWKSLLLR